MGAGAISPPDWVCTQVVNDLKNFRGDSRVSRECVATGWDTIVGNLHMTIKPALPT